MVILIHVDVVQSYVPFLVGLDILNKYGIVLFKVNNVFRCYSLNIRILVVRIYEHIFLEWLMELNILHTYEYSKN